MIVNCSFLGEGLGTKTVVCLLNNEEGHARALDNYHHDALPIAFGMA